MTGKNRIMIYGPKRRRHLRCLNRRFKTSLAAQAGRSVKLIEGTIGPTAVEVTAPPALEPPKPKNRLMLEVDTAIGPRERKPRAVPSPAEAPVHRGCARSKTPA